MSNATLKPMNIGQTERIHVAYYGQDNVNSPSQNLDTTTQLAVQGMAGKCTVATVAGDNRAFDITAVAAGSVVLQVTTAAAPFLTISNQLNASLVINSPPVDTRRCDFVSADDPV